jgi:charged multivesicular body protein 2A
MGNQLTFQDHIRENKRMVNRTIRELERECMASERDVDKLKEEIRTMAAKGQMGSVKSIAKGIARTNASITKSYKMRDNLMGLEIQLKTIKSSHDMAKVMAKTAKAMKRMNRKMNFASVQRMVNDYAMGTEQMDLKMELLEDIMDEGFEDEMEDEDEIVGKVLAELGIELTADLHAAPTTSLPSVDIGESELKLRLDNLRRD